MTEADVQNCSDWLADQIDESNVRQANGEAFVGLDELGSSFGTNEICDHTVWIGDSRLYALEPNPETGYWTCCPKCAMVLGQRNLGDLPRELTEI